MPILDLGEWPKRKEVLAIHRLWAVMLYPNNQIKQYEHIVLGLAEMGIFLEESSEDIKLSIKNCDLLPDGALEFLELYVRDLHKKASKHADSLLRSMDGIKILFNSPNTKSKLKEHTESFKNGMVAGEILILLKQMVDAKIENVSKRKAVDLILILRGKQLKKEGMRAVNRDAFQNIWKEYRTVAHLWATNFLLDTNDYPANYTLDSDTGVIGFLNIAEEFRKFSTSFIPYQDKSPLITEKETWCGPKNLPYQSLPVNPPPLSQEQLNVLESYQSKIRPSSR